MDFYLSNNLCIYVLYEIDKCFFFIQSSIKQAMNKIVPFFYLILIVKQL